MKLSMKKKPGRSLGLTMPRIQIVDDVLLYCIFYVFELVDHSLDRRGLVSQIDHS